MATDVGENAGGIPRRPSWISLVKSGLAWHDPLMSKDPRPPPFGDAPTWLLIVLIVVALLLLVSLIVQGLSASP